MPSNSNSTAARPVYSREVFYWHYAWMIVAIIALMQMVGSSIRMAFGVFIYPLSEEFGWSQGSITLAYALSSIVTALASPVAGSLGDRFGARKSMMLGCTMFIGGMLLIGVVNQVWQFYLTFGLLLGVAQAVFLVPLIPSAMTWFRRHLGVGMGFLMAAWGLGPALTAPLDGTHDPAARLARHLLGYCRRVCGHNGVADPEVQQPARRPRSRTVRRLAWRSTGDTTFAGGRPS